MLTKASSNIPDEIESIVHQTIGCAIAVHSALGPGYVEAVYHKAMCIELKHRGLRFATERAVQIQYRGEVIHGHRLDLVVEDAVVVELKAVDRIDAIHRAQVTSYLRAMKLLIGLIINFNTDWLKGSIKRVVVS